MTTSSRRVHAKTTIFLSWGFLISLSLLLLNDFLFKGLYGNWVTGKLSDVTGLFIFPLALTALAPKRIKSIHLGTAAAFVLFKTPLATPLIEAWNSMGILTMGRVIDYTDFMALPMIGGSYLYARTRLSPSVQQGYTFSRRLATNMVLILSLFAFAATNRADKTTPVRMTSTIPYCASDVMAVLPHIVLKKQKGVANVTHVNKHYPYFEVTVTSKQAEHVYSNKYKDVGFSMGIMLSQRCTSEGCYTVPRFACNMANDSKGCSRIHHLARKRVEKEVERLWARVQRELQRNGAKQHPATCGPIKKLPVKPAAKSGCNCSSPKE